MDLCAFILAGGIVKILTMFKIQAGLEYSFWHSASTALYSALLWFLIKWAVEAIGNWAGAGKGRLAPRR